MKFNLRLQVTRLITIGKAQLQSIQTSLGKSVQSCFRFIKLQLSAVTKLSPQSTLLRLLALLAAALMAVLAIGGLQTISQSAPAQSNSTSKPAAKAPAETAKGAKPQTSTAVPSQPAAPEATSPVPTAVLTHSSLSTYAPRLESAPAHPSNYGERYAKDIFGKPVSNAPLIVLHETVGSADSAINTFQTPHTDENLQSSYHSIIRLDGTIVYIVPPEKRAFGAGNSVFKSSKGAEAVRTHRQFPPSVNNFAYHISLETPSDGYNDAPSHSGYTEAQYRSLAWLVAHTSVSDDRVTTHRAIDQSGSRMDPRSFDAQKFYSYLRSMPRPYLNQ